MKQRRPHACDRATACRGRCGRADAETLALSYCNASDARIIVWVKNGYCAPALGNDLGAYGVAWASTAAEARWPWVRPARSRLASTSP